MTKSGGSKNVVHNVFRQKRNATETEDSREHILTMLMKVLLLWISMVGRFLCSFLVEKKLLGKQFHHKPWDATFGGTTTLWHERTIVDRCGSTQEDDKNDILVRAMSEYLHHLETTRKFPKAFVNLSTTTLTRGEQLRDNSCDNQQQRHHFSNQLARYQRVYSPPDGTWHAVCKKYSNRRPNPDQTIETNNDDDTTTLHEVQIMRRTSKNAIEWFLRSTGADAVDQFLDEAYAWYTARLQQQEQVWEKRRVRYYFDWKQQQQQESKTSRSGPPIFRRVALSDEKTMDSLFFRQRDHLVRVLRDFVHQTGKFSVAGYPHQLRLLLHGPPGTGKTSLIKAMAQYTGRSIVNIPLARIRTNAELHQLLYTNEFHYEGSYYPAKLRHRNVIYVMEDIDAASKVVQSCHPPPHDGRNLQHGRHGGRIHSSSAARLQQDQTQHVVNLPPPKSLWQMLLESPEKHAVELVRTLVEKSDRLQKIATSSGTLCHFAGRLQSFPPGLALAGRVAEMRKINLSSSSSSAAADVQRLTSDALREGNALIKGYKKRNKYLDFHAKSILKLLSMGAVVDEAFENELLGISNQQSCPPIDGPPCDSVNGDDPKVAAEKIGEVYTRSNSRTCHALSQLVAQAVNQELSLSSFAPDHATEASLEDSTGFGASDGVMEQVNFSHQGVGGAGLDGGKGLLGLGLDTAMNQQRNSFGTGMNFRGVLQGLFDRSIADEFNLQGLLKVLDGGIIDTPGRILVMTTNHPERLDEALIQKVDKTLYLGSMDAKDVALMLEHYFQLQLDENQISRIHAAVQGGVDGKKTQHLTPAQVEQLIVEHDDIADMITALEGKRNSMQ